MSPGIPLLSTNDWDNLLMEDYAMEQLRLLDVYLMENQSPGAPNWARQVTILPDAYIGRTYYHTLNMGVDFWDPEGDAIIGLFAVAEDNPPSWLTIAESTSQPGTWVLSGMVTDTEPTDYSFGLRIEDSSGGRNREAELEVLPARPSCIRHQVWGLY
jgi:hypothetical protein